MEIIELKAEARSGTGKNKARQLRAVGKLPVILYGNKDESTNLAVDTRELTSLFRARAGSNLILKLVVDGGESSSVMIKDIQRDPVRDDILHIDFLRVALDEKIVAGVTVKLTGDSIGVRDGGILQHGLWELQVEALPTDLPEYIEVDISGLDLGQSIHAGEVTLPAGLTMASSAEEVVASIVAPAKEVVEEVVEEELEEAAGAEGAAAEGGGAPAEEGAEES